jgi:hypothetical protein
VLVFLGSSILTSSWGCGGAAFSEEQRIRFQRQLQRLNSVQIADGIDERDAYIIADVYCQVYLGECGGAEKPIQHGPIWASLLRYGEGARPWGLFEIHTDTGLVGTCAEYFSGIEAMRSDVRARAGERTQDRKQP